MGASDWDVGHIAVPTVAAGLLFVYMIFLWADIAIRKCYLKNGRR
jgi:hypothetical protein